MPFQTIVQTRLSMSGFRVCAKSDMKSMSQTVVHNCPGHHECEWGTASRRYGNEAEDVDVKSSSSSKVQTLKTHPTERRAYQVNHRVLCAHDATSTGTSPGSASMRACRMLAHPCAQGSQSTNISGCECKAWTICSLCG